MIITLINTQAIGELPPAIVTYPESIVIEQGALFNYKIDALNYTGGGNELSYSCVNKPTWLSYDAGTETLNGTASSIGEFAVRLRVPNTTDPSVYSEQHFIIVVKAPAVPNPYETIWTTGEPVFVKVGDSFKYVHPKRSDDPNLQYIVETTSDLVAGAWTNADFTILGTNVLSGAYDEVTNSVPADVAQSYIRLRVTSQ